MLCTNYFWGIYNVVLGIWQTRKHDIMGETAHSFPILTPHSASKIIVKNVFFGNPLDGWAQCKTNGYYNILNLSNESILKHSWNKKTLF